MKQIQVSGGKYVAIVDDDDFERVAQHRWWFCRGYAYTQWMIAGRKYNIRLHRFIVNAADDVLVDHRNRERLDCRKVNLRVATWNGNAMNAAKRKNAASRFKGVWRNNPLCKKNPWVASITAFGVRHYLGTFPSEDAAAMAYDRAARHHFGEFAVLNLPCDSPALV